MILFYKGHLIIDEEAAAVVREVFSLSAKGYGKTAIAGMLNDRGIYRTRPNTSVCTDCVMLSLKQRQAQCERYNKLYTEKTGKAFAFPIFL